MKSIDTILKYASLAYALMIFIGYVNIHSYYAYFGIDINSHLSVSELLFGFLETSEFFMWIAVFLTVAFIIDGGLNRALAYVEKMLTPNRKTTLLWVQVIFMGVLLAVLVFGAWSIVEMLFAIFSGGLVYMKLWWVVEVICCPILFLGIFRALAKYKEADYFNYIGALAAGLNWLAFLIIWNYSVASKITITEGMGVVIELENRVISTDSTWGYIGKCNEAVFLWNRKDAASQTIYTKEIKTMYFIDPRLQKLKLSKP